LISELQEVRGQLHFPAEAAPKVPTRKEAGWAPKPVAQSVLLGRRQKQEDRNKNGRMKMNKGRNIVRKKKYRNKETRMT
jgi:hypothetical protein